MDGGGHRGRAVGAQDQLRRLDLDLEAERTLVEPVRRLERRTDGDHGLDLADGAHLREGEHELFGHLAHALEQRTEEEVEGTDAAAPGRRLEALEADADEVGAGARLQRVGDGTGGRDAVGVFGRVAAVAVPVLEVEAQVFDGCGAQLGVDAARDLLGHVTGQAQVGGEGRKSAVLLDQVEGGGPPLPRQRGGVAVGRNVDGVHRLAPAVVTGVGEREHLVGVTELGVDPAQEVFGQHGIRHLRSPSRTPEA